MKGRIFLFLFAIPFAGFGTWMLLMIVGEVRDTLSMRNWQPVEARLLTAGYETRSDEDGETWRAYASYEYNWHTQRYTGDRVAVADGADNIGSYQKNLGDRLSRALADGQAITVYVDPASPSNSVVDRNARWGLLGFKSIFVFVFGGVGYGLMFFTIRAPKPKDPEAPEFSDAPWLVNDDWQGDAIRSGSKDAMWAAWAFAALWNLISMPLPFLLWEEIAEKQNIPALIGFVFPVIGIGLLYTAISRTREWRRFGPTPLELDPFPGAIGGHVGGSIDLNVPFTSGARYQLTLTNVHSYISGSGKNRSRQENARWQDRRLAHAEPGPRGTRLAFRFDVPDDLPPSDAAKGSDSYTIWRLNVAAEFDGRDLDRDWEIPVYPTGARSRSVDARKVGAAKSEQASVDDAVVRKRVRLRHTATGKSLYYPMGRNALSIGMGLLAGIVFAGVGWHLLSAEGEWLFGGISSLIGWAIVLFAIYSLGISLEVYQDGIQLYSKRRWLGLPIRTRQLHRNAFYRFEKSSDMQIQSGNKHTVIYSIYAIGRSAEQITLGEGFRGDSEADAGIRLIARELGLPLPDEPSANDDRGDGNGLEYNALAADN